MDIKYGPFSFHESGIPVPQISYNFNPQTTSAGRQVGTELEINLKGQIYGTGNYAAMRASGLYNAFERDYQQLRLLCLDGGTETLLFPKDELKTDLDKTIYVKDLSFTNSSDETMYYIIDFDITLGGSLKEYQHYVTGDGDDLFLRSLNDNWNVEMVNDNPEYLFETNQHFYPSGGPPGNTYYNISRVVSAAGYANKDSTSFDNAKKGVKAVLKNSPSLFSELPVLKDTPGGNHFKIFNRKTNYEADMVEGGLTFTETYIAFTGNPEKKYTHSFNISNTLDKDFNRTVTINGTIQGYTLEPDDDSKTDASANQLSNDNFFKNRQTAHNAYINASGGLDKELPHAYPRALDSTKFPSGQYLTRYDDNQDYQDFVMDSFSNANASPPVPKRQEWLNPIYRSFNADHDINNGTINYSISYDNRIFTLIPGAFVEQLSVNDTFPVTGYATQNIMYRGSLPQHLGTLTTPSRTVSYNATFPSIISNDGEEVNDEALLSEGDYNGEKLANAMNQFDPARIDPSPNTPGSYVTSWVTEDSFEINFVEGTISKTLSWNYTIGK